MNKKPINSTELLEAVNTIFDTAAENVESESEVDFINKTENQLCEFIHNLEAQPTNTQFLMSLDPDCPITCLPETTLWSSFHEAMEVLLEAFLKEALVISPDAEIFVENDHLFIEGIVEILPISTSKRNNFTWLGRSWSSKFPAITE